MPRKNRDRYNDWLWRPAGDLQIPPAGEVVIREPREGWSPGFYQAVLQQYFAVRGTYPSTALAVAPTDGVLPVWWPIYEIRRHYAPARIILTDDPPQVLQR